MSMNGSSVPGGVRRGRAAHRVLNDDRAGRPPGAGRARGRRRRGRYGPACCHTTSPSSRRGPPLRLMPRRKPGAVPGHRAAGAARDAARRARAQARSSVAGSSTARSVSSTFPRTACEYGQTPLLALLLQGPRLRRDDRDQAPDTEDVRTPGLRRRHVRRRRQGLVPGRHRARSGARGHPGGQARRRTRNGDLRTVRLQAGAGQRPLHHGRRRPRPGRAAPAGRAQHVPVPQVRQRPVWRPVRLGGPGHGDQRRPVPVHGHLLEHGALLRPRARQPDRLRARRPTGRRGPSERSARARLCCQCPMGRSGQVRHSGLPVWLARSDARIATCPARVPQVESRTVACRPWIRTSATVSRAPFRSCARCPCRPRRVPGGSRGLCGAPAARRRAGRRTVRGPRRYGPVHRGRRWEATKTRERRNPC